MYHHPPDSLIITTLFGPLEINNVEHQYYRHLVLQTLKKILPTDFFESIENEEDTAFFYQKQLLQKIIPFITYSEVQKFPGTFSFFALSKYRFSSFKFFFDMISRWLTPGRRLNVVLVYATDFRITARSEEVYTICEVAINVANQAEFEEIQRNFPLIKPEIAMGIQSEFYAQRMMESKGLMAEDKAAFIQGFIDFLVKRFPAHYKNDVFTEMQHILVTCSDEFKSMRHTRHLSRIISVQYLFRQWLREALKKNPHRRHLHLKLFRELIKTPTGCKRVLSVLVGINFIREQENFGEKI